MFGGIANRDTTAVGSGGEKAVFRIKHAYVRRSDMAGWFSSRQT